MTALTKEQLEAIRKRHIDDQRPHNDSAATRRGWGYGEAHADRGNLLAEVDRLLAESDRYRNLFLAAKADNDRLDALVIKACEWPHLCAVYAALEQKP